MAGISSRQLTFLASFWPANALLLGLLIRFPILRNRYTILGAVIGYLCADYISGSSWPLNIALAISNLSYVITTLILYLYFLPYLERLHRGYFYLCLFAFCCLGSIVGSLVATTLIPLTNQVFMIGPFWQEFIYWFTAEIQNALILVPIILSLPHWQQLTSYKKVLASISVVKILPLIALCISLIVSFYDPGPGSLLYPVTALIWCALTYSTFSMTLMTAFCATFLIYHSISNYTLLYPESYLINTVSIRIGVIMLMIAPLTISNINEIRTTLIQDLRYLVAYDDLTKTLTRRQFYKSAQDILDQIHLNKTGGAILMLDIDHFKFVNDQYGHAIGDKVLQHFCWAIKNCLRKDDIFGRLGGEEFAVILNNQTTENPTQVAENIRESVSQMPIYLENGEAIYIQVSIGIRIIHSLNQYPIDYLIKKADEALYQAKQQGRNIVFTQL